VIELPGNVMAKSRTCDY